MAVSVGFKKRGGRLRQNLPENYPRLGGGVGEEYRWCMGGGPRGVGVVGIEITMQNAPGYADKRSQPATASGQSVGSFPGQTAVRGSIGVASAAF